MLRMCWKFMVLILLFSNIGCRTEKDYANKNINSNVSADSSTISFVNEDEDLRFPSLDGMGSALARYTTFAFMARASKKYLYIYFDAGGASRKVEKIIITDQTKQQEFPILEEYSKIDTGIVSSGHCVAIPRSMIDLSLELEKSKISIIYKSIKPDDILVPEFSS